MNLSCFFSTRSVQMLRHNVSSFKSLEFQSISTKMPYRRERYVFEECHNRDEKACLYVKGTLRP